MLVAVSKNQNAQAILKLYNGGQRDFGENRVQEMRDKYNQLPKDIRWHLIGHLQKNKIKYIAEWVHLIHSADGPDLLIEINKQAIKYNRIIPCLLQVHIAKEETKFGLNEDELFNLVNLPELKNLQNVGIQGLMGIATNTDDEKIIASEFEYLASLFKTVKRNYFLSSDEFKHLSMGMSNDYKIAIEKGATIVRIGSLLFTKRQ